MKFLNTIFGIFLGLGLLAVLAAGLFWVVKFFMSFFGGLDRELSTILTTVTLSIIFGAIIISNAVRTKMKQDGYPGNIDKKTTAYQYFIETCIRMHPETDSPNHENGTMIANSFKEFNQQLALWGSDKVLKEYLVFQKQLDEMAISHRGVLRQFEKIILAMRKDLNQNNWGIREGQILKLLLKETKDPEMSEAPVK